MCYFDGMSRRLLGELLSLVNLEITSKLHLSYSSNSNIKSSSFFEYNFHKHRPKQLLANVIFITTMHIHVFLFIRLRRGVSPFTHPTHPHIPHISIYPIYPIYPIHPSFLHPCYPSSPSFLTTTTPPSH